MAQASEIIRGVYGTDSGDGWQGALATWTEVPSITEARLFGVAYHINNDAGVPVGTTVAKLFYDLSVTTYFGSGMLTDPTRQAEMIAYFVGHTTQECYTWINQKLLDPTYTGQSIPSVTAKWEELSVYAVANGLALGSYEGGTHIVVSIYVPPEVKSLVYNTLIGHDNSPEMGELYSASWSAWETVTDEPYTHYYDFCKPSEFGTWGAKRSLDAPISPKWAALSSKSRGLPYQTGFVGVTANVSS